MRFQVRELGPQSVEQLIGVLGWPESEGSCRVVQLAVSNLTVDKVGGDGRGVEIGRHGGHWNEADLGDGVEMFKVDCRVVCRLRMPRGG